MQEDFHYYATYCAAILAGYSHEDSRKVCYSAQLVDLCSETWLSHLKAPRSAATTQLSMEMADARTDLLGLQKITRIWASFHFLPGDLYAEKKHCSRRYRSKYRMICQPNGALVEKTVELARGKSLQAAGIAMHVLADTWAHRNFAGTPSLVINNTDYDFYELLETEQGISRRKIRFRHNPGAKDDPDQGLYLNSLYQSGENSVMNLGHGRAGHLPDYSFLCYEYVPAWADYDAVIKNNPKEYELAFCQMVYALRALRDGTPFQRECYDRDVTALYLDEIRSILKKRQLIASEDWKAFGEKLSGKAVDDFDLAQYEAEYQNAAREEKNDTFLGRFILAALAQKSMVTGEVFRSGNLLAGFSVDPGEKGFRGIRDFRILAEELRREREEEAS